MAFPNSQSNPASAIPVWVTPPPPGGNAGITGVSSNSSVGAASAAIVTPGQFSTWLTIQNTHASQTLNVSYNSPATANDVKIPAGGSLTLPFSAQNTLYALGSGAATTYALIGY